MPTSTVGARRTDAVAEPPSLLVAVLEGFALGTAVLVAAATALAAVSALPHGSPVWPWPADGTWAFAADLGWCLVVVALVTSTIRWALARRIPEPVSPVAIALAVSLGGLLPLAAVDHGPAGSPPTVAALALAACLVAWLVAVLALRDGEPRRWPALPGPAAAMVSVAAGLGLTAAGSYGLLHPLSQAAGGGDRTTVVVAGEHAPASIRVALARGRARAAVLAAQPTGRVDALQDGPPTIRDAGRRVAVSLPVRRTGCTGPAPRVTGVRVRYRLHGLALSQTVPLRHAVLVACRGR